MYVHISKNHTRHTLSKAYKMLKLLLAGLFIILFFVSITADFECCGCQEDRTYTYVTNSTSVTSTYNPGCAATTITTVETWVYTTDAWTYSDPTIYGHPNDDDPGLDDPGSGCNPDTGCGPNAGSPVN